jgi:hypothetical protein
MYGVQLVQEESMKVRKVTKEEILAKSVDELHALAPVLVGVNTWCRDCTKCNSCTNCNYCTNCSSCNYCYLCTNCHCCNDCNDCTKCINCTKCSQCDYCIGITNGNGLQYVVYGVQLSKEEYEGKFGK